MPRPRTRGAQTIGVTEIPFLKASRLNRSLRTKFWRAYVGDLYFYQTFVCCYALCTATVENLELI